MESIFLIRRRTGDYEGCDSIEGFVTTKEEAESVVETANMIYHESLKVYTVYSDEYYKKLNELKLLPEFVMEEIVAPPKWRAGIHQKDITAEMREERDSIHKSNDEKAKRNSVKSNEMSRLSNEHASSFILELIKNEGIDMRIYERVKRMHSSFGAFYYNEYYSEEVEQITELV